jgi:hypothetical protein
MGNTQVMAAVMIAGTVPAPNQMTRMGTTATFGIDEKPMRSGYPTS